MDRSSQGLKIIIRNSDGTSSDVTMYSDDGKLPSTIEFGGAVRTTDVKVSEIEAAEDEPLIGKEDGDDPESGTPAKKTQWVGVYSTIQESLTALCALATSVIMIMTLVKFFSTSHIAGAWPTNPKLYPTYLLLITSLITLTIDIFSLGERYCRRASAKKVDTMISKMRYALLIFQAIGSATGVGVFKGTQAAGSGQDLFGWTCSDAADQMANVNSSDLICNSNISSSILSLLQTGLHVLGIIITVVTMLGPKAIGPSKSTDNDDGETATKPNTKRLSCGSCGRPISGSKPDGKKPPTDAEKPEDKPKQDETKSKPDEPQVDTEAIKSIVKQSQGLYTRLQPSSDPQDFSHYGEPDLNSMPGDNFTNVDMNGAQTVYANADVNSRQVAYDNFNIQSFQ